MGNPDEWLETVRKCEYLPEQDIKKLCEMVTLRSWINKA
jgi:serine/threonine-protein phosphatase PP1-1/serine/threonine-protein phosphatase 6 catalytic subunit